VGQSPFAPLVAGERLASVPEPLRVYNAIRQAAAPGGLDGDFSAAVCDF